jgi:hypothetical protein
LTQNPAHTGAGSQGWATYGIFGYVTGSGNNTCCSNGDTGLNISVHKQNWNTTGSANVGEVDGLQVTLRQSNPFTGTDLGGYDAGSLILNQLMTGPIGFIAASEAVTTHLNSSLVQDYQIDIQWGGYKADNSAGFRAYGVTMSLLSGTLDHGFHVESPCGGCTISYAFDYANLFSVDGSGNIIGRHIWGGGAPLTQVSTNCGGANYNDSGTDTTGKIYQTSGSVTSCQVAFSVAYVNGPWCVVTPGGAPSTSQVVTTTTGFTATFGTAQTQFYYMCMGA